MIVTHAYSHSHHHSHSHNSVGKTSRKASGKEKVISPKSNKSSNSGDSAPDNHGNANTDAKSSKSAKSSGTNTNTNTTNQTTVEKRLGSMKLNLTSLVNESKPKEYQFLLENCKVNAIAKMTIFIKHLGGNGGIGVCGSKMMGEDQQQLQNLYNIPEQTSNQIYHGIRETITRDRSVSPGALSSSSTTTSTNNGIGGFPLQKSHSLRSRLTKRTNNAGVKSNSNASNLSLTLSIPPSQNNYHTNNMPISPASGSSMASMVNAEGSWNKLRGSRSRKNSMSSYNSSISNSNSSLTKSITAGGVGGGAGGYNQQHYPNTSAIPTPTTPSFNSKPQQHQQSQNTLTIPSVYNRPHLHSIPIPHDAPNVPLPYPSHTSRQHTHQTQPTPHAACTHLSLAAANIPRSPSPSATPTPNTSSGGAGGGGQQPTTTILGKTFRFSCDIANIKYEEFTPRECIEDITLYKGQGWKRDELGHLMIDLLKETLEDLREKKFDGSGGAGDGKAPAELYFDDDDDGDDDGRGGRGHGGNGRGLRGVRGRGGGCHYDDSFEFRDGSHAFHEGQQLQQQQSQQQGAVCDERGFGNGDRDAYWTSSRKTKTNNVDEELLLLEDGLSKRYKPLLECEYRDDLKSWHLQY
ncbi:unnamed protein product [Ambrosiozyma monospora]|uniref:Unnamed protein product n=1 Tax=Ambrosiozyma monospora TaxID=43982 RepID=A0ACB5T2R2_AMBMO|nr:unnamed protein product [Ambrosiozyma monospora]